MLRKIHLLQILRGTEPVDFRQQLGGEVVGVCAILIETVNESEAKCKKVKKRI